MQQLNNKYLKYLLLWKKTGIRLECQAFNIKTSILLQPEKIPTLIMKILGLLGVVNEQ